MGEDKRSREVLEGALDSLDNDIVVVLFDFFSSMKMKKNDMKNALDLLDDTSEGSKKAKDQLRKKILDNYNDLPRDTLEFIEELTKILK